MRLITLVLFLALCLTAARTDLRAAAALSLGSESLSGPSLILDPERARAGERLMITYRPDGERLSGKITGGRLVYFSEKQLGFRDIELREKDGVWLGSVTLPDSATAFGVALHGGDNNGGKGYIFPVYGADREKPVAGSLAAASQFYTGIGQLLLGAARNVDTVLQLLETDISRNPLIKRDWEFQYLFALLVAKRDEAHTAISSHLEEILSRPVVGEDELTGAYQLYRNIQMPEKSDSLSEIIQSRYPFGQLAQQKIKVTFSGLSNIDSMVVLYRQFSSDFAVSVDNDRRTRAFASEMAMDIAEAYAEQEDDAGFMHYARQIDNQREMLDAFAKTAELFLDKGNIHAAERVSEAALNLIGEQIAEMADTDGSTDSGPRMDRLKERRGTLFHLHAKILFGKGDVTGAASFQRRAFDDTQGRDRNINRDYIRYLMDSGDMTAAGQGIAKLIRIGKETAGMEAMLKQAYLANRGSENGYEAYLSGIRGEGAKTVRQQITGDWLDKPAPDFELSDLNGNRITLASFAGSVVVIDFWATWCGPCKASFPGMQQAIRGFGDDENVVFLFINTMERISGEERGKQIKHFLQETDYDFHVLLDEPGSEEQSSFRTAHAYGVRGIPAKFIIGPDGKVRYIDIGFDGDNEGLVRKLTVMVENAKRGTP